MIGRNVQIDVLQRVVGSVPRIQVRHLDADAHLACSFQNSAAGHIPHQRNRNHNQHDQHQRARPCQPVPVLVGTGRINLDLQRQRRDRLIRIVLQNALPNAVKISGAVSPATRANASMQPVMMPGEAVFTVIESTERQFGTPSPSAASRTAFGTISSISSVVRAPWESS